MTIEHHTRVRDVLAISELTSLELYELLELAHLMKLQPRGWLDALAGETVACFFQKPSTRTRVSLHGAIARLGGAPLLIRPDELQLGRGEPVSDTARVLSGYACAIAARWTKPGSGARSAGAATAMCMPASAPASSREWATLLPSPM